MLTSRDNCMSSSTSTRSVGWSHTEAGTIKRVLQLLKGPKVPVSQAGEIVHTLLANLQLLSSLRYFSHQTCIRDSLFPSLHPLSSPAISKASFL